MTKAELIDALAPFSDDCRITVRRETGSAGRPTLESHVERVEWEWPKGEDEAHVTLISLPWDFIVIGGWTPKQEE